jgi:hypothetical protein
VHAVGTGRLTDPGRGLSPYTDEPANSDTCQRNCYLRVRICRLVRIGYEDVAITIAPRDVIPLHYRAPGRPPLGLTGHSLAPSSTAVLAKTRQPTFACPASHLAGTGPSADWQVSKDGSRIATIRAPVTRGELPPTCLRRSQRSKRGRNPAQVLSNIAVVGTLHPATARAVCRRSRWRRKRQTVLKVGIA